MLIISQSFIWFTTLADCGLILATLYPSSRLSQHFTSYLGVSTSGVTPLQISPLAFLGIILAIFGSLFRHAAVRELGPMFTYELAVRQNHRLITSGPYAVVRHPGYSGVLLFVLGSVLAGSTAQGGLVREVVLPRLGWTGEPWTAYSVIGATVAFISQIGILGGLFARVPKEDAMLRREFGREWEEWACRVPYKLMPLLY